MMQVPVAINTRFNARVRWKRALKIKTLDLTQTV
jgi:hypothetical protein